MVTNVRYQIMDVLKGIAAVLPIMKKTTIWSYLKENNKKRGLKEMSKTDNYIFELSDKVTRKSVSYNNRFGIKIAADLYLPKDFDDCFRG
ncbi:MAG: hypothetical protein ACQEWV_20065 [Bacillota bacterium]